MVDAQQAVDAVRQVVPGQFDALIDLGEEEHVAVQVEDEAQLSCGPAPLDIPGTDAESLKLRAFLVFPER